MGEAIGDLFQKKGGVVDFSDADCDAMEAREDL